MTFKKLKLVVLISGNGSNLQTIIDKCTTGELPVEIAAVISNKANAYGLQRAQQANITTVVVENRNHNSQESYDTMLQAEIDKYTPDLVVLAGFMRILSEAFVQHYLGKMINIHPSLLPAYRGLNTHQRVLDDQQQIHGVSIHFVTAELDGGPLIAQSQVAVAENDTAETLAKKVQREEHQLYPLVLQWFAHDRLKMREGDIFFDDKKLEKPILLHHVN